MEVRDLKEDVLQKLDGALEFLQAGGENAVAYGYDLSEENPVITVQVPVGYRIIVLNTLAPQEQAELVAHELCHLLLQAEGIYSVALLEDGPEAYLAQEMNNVIFHHLIVKRLTEVYGIGNSVYVAHRKLILGRIEQLIEEYTDESLLLYGLGLHLLDLTLTMEDQDDETEQRIAKVLEQSRLIKRAYELGEEYLVYPNSEVSAEEQWKRISTFVQHFGFDPIDIRLRGGLVKTDEDEWE